MGSIWRRLSLFSKVHLLFALFGVHAEFFLDSGNPTGFQYLLIIKRCYSSIFSAVLLTKWNTFTHVLSLLLSVVFVWFSTCSNGWFLLESISNFSLLFDLFSCVSGSLVLCLVPLFGILVFFQMFPHHNSSVCLKSTRLSGVCYKFELLPVACSFVFWDVAALTVSSLHMRSLSFFLYLRFLQCVDWTASCGLQFAGVHFEFCVWKETKTWRKAHLQTHQLIQSRVNEPHERKRPSWVSPVSSGVSDAHWSSSFWWFRCLRPGFSSAGGCQRDDMMLLYTNMFLFTDDKSP